VEDSYFFEGVWFRAGNVVRGPVSWSIVREMTEFSIRVAADEVPWFGDDVMPKGCRRERNYGCRSLGPLSFCFILLFPRVFVEYRMYNYSTV
jgi:hypothetical protein